ncbi:MAG: acyl-CoA dehydrogenase family protein [Desertimonas sp.]
MPPLDQFIDEAVQFLDEVTVPRSEDEGFRWGKGPDRINFMSSHTREEELAEVEAARSWRALRYDAGLGYLTGPPEYGGRGLGHDYEAAYRSAELDYVVPSQECFTIGLGMVAPTIQQHGTDVVKQRYLAALHRGDILAAQLFSEPGAGSDLAGLQLRAERDGEGWVLNGQKVWTSGAHHAHIGEVLCRTNPHVPKHQGITAFVVDLRAPGVDIRPLHQMNGGAHFNEVFLDDVFVPDDHRLGDVDRGWAVALSTLMNERAAVGTGAASFIDVADLDRLAALVDHEWRGDSTLARDALATIYSSRRLTEISTQRALAGLQPGEAPGPELSMGKLTATRNIQRVSNLVGDVLGPKLVADTGEWGTFAWANVVLGGPGSRIAGGTDEIMKNILGERVLGLPKEPGQGR